MDQHSNQMMDPNNNKMMDQNNKITDHSNNGQPMDGAKFGNGIDICLGQLSGFFSNIPTKKKGAATYEELVRYFSDQYVLTEYQARGVFRTLQSFDYMLQPDGTINLSAFEQYIIRSVGDDISAFGALFVSIGNMFIPAKRVCDACESAKNPLASGASFAHQLLAHICLRYQEHVIKNIESNAGAAWKNRNDDPAGPVTNLLNHLVDKLVREAGISEGRAFEIARIAMEQMNQCIGKQLMIEAGPGDTLTNDMVQNGQFNESIQDTGMGRSIMGHNSYEQGMPINGIAMPIGNMPIIHNTANYPVGNIQMANMTMPGMSFNPSINHGQWNGLQYPYQYHPQSGYSQMPHRSIPNTGRLVMANSIMPSTYAIEGNNLTGMGNQFHGQSNAMIHMMNQSGQERNIIHQPSINQMWMNQSMQTTVPSCNTLPSVPMSTHYRDMTRRSGPGHISNKPQESMPERSSSLSKLTDRLKEVFGMGLNKNESKQESQTQTVLKKTVQSTQQIPPISLVQSYVAGMRPIEQIPHNILQQISQQGYPITMAQTDGHHQLQ